MIAGPKMMMTTIARILRITHFSLQVCIRIIVNVTTAVAAMSMYTQAREGGSSMYRTPSVPGSGLMSGATCVAIVRFRAIKDGIFICMTLYISGCDSLQCSIRR